MKPRMTAIAGLAALVAALAACESVPPAPATEEQAAATPFAAQDEVLDVRAAMVEGINPPALAIWDIGNNAMNDEGGLDPALIDDAAWTRLEQAAQTLATHSRRMADAQVLRAAGPDLVDGKVPEGVASREEIQAMIDANPAGFRALSAEMGRQAQAIAEAASAHDLERTGELVFGIETVCQACHQAYWYPQQ